MPELITLLVYEMSPRIFFAVLCGGMIGLERELKHKRVGIKTCVLICLGSSVYTTVGVLLSRELMELGHYGDPARVSAQIVSGIGFLGGGVIYIHKGHIVRGLTTASIIWTVGAIGILIGLCYYYIALYTALAVIIILQIINYIEQWTTGEQRLFSFTVEVERDIADFRHQLNALLRDFDLELDGFQINDSPQKVISYGIQYRTHTDLHQRLILKLWLIDGVFGVKE
jgi:putative Mg2+ transporter-C (MgtC) family protein